MAIEFVDKLKAVMRKRGVNLIALAKRTDQSVQNLSNKMRRNKFTEEEMRKYAEALDCNFDVHFELKDTGEKI